MSSLSEMIHHVRLQDHHRSRRNRAEVCLGVVRATYAVRSRMVRGSHNLLRKLARALRADDQKRFLEPFRAFQILNNACEEFEMASIGFDKDLFAGPCISSSFFLDMPKDDRAMLLKFIRKVCKDPDYVSQCLSRLSNADFDALFSSNRPSGALLANDPGRGHSDDFLDLGRHNVLLLMFHVAEANLEKSGVPRSYEYWSKICAASISQKRPGADRLATRILTIWTQSADSTNSRPLEAWLLQVLRDGQFLLDRPGRHSSRLYLTPEVKGVNPADSFFNQCISDLLEIMKMSLTNGTLPCTTITLVRSIVGRLHAYPEQFHAAPYMLCARWLFSSYLSDIIRYPESSRLLLSYHVPSLARKRILDELAIRLQKFTSDFMNASHTPGNSELHSKMEAVVSLFRPESSLDSVSSEGAPTSPPGWSNHAILVMCPMDIITLASGLLGLGLEDRNDISSASSVSGSSVSRPGTYDDSIASMDRECFLDFHALPTPKSGQNFCEQRRHSSIDEPGELSFINNIGRITANLLSLYGDSNVARNKEPFSEEWTLIPESTDILEHEAVYGKHETIDGESGNSFAATAVPHYVVSALRALAHCSDSSRPHSTSPTSPVAGDRPASTGVDCDDHRDVLASVERSFARAGLACQRNSELAKVHLFHRAQQWICASSEYDQKALTSLVISIIRTAKNSWCTTMSITDEINAQVEELTINMRSQLSRLLAIAEAASRLREKMWYNSSFRFSSGHEDLTKVASALKVMGPAPHTTKFKSHVFLRQRKTGSTLYDTLALKSESAILELLTAPLSCGGPSKLADKQVSVITNWLQHYGIENLCKGEERLQRFCHEVSKCVHAVIGNDFGDHAMLLSSELYREVQHDQGQRSPYSGLPRSDNARAQLQRLYYQQSASSDSKVTEPSLLSSSHAPSTTGFGMMHRNWPDKPRSCSPAFSTSTSDTIWSGTASERVTSSTTSLPSHTPGTPLRHWSSDGYFEYRQEDRVFLDEIKHRITSLILSDLGHVFHLGSETDTALFQSFGGRFANRVSAPAFAPDPSVTGWTTRTSDFFDLTVSFRSIFHKFELTPGPYEKMQMLYQVQTLYQEMLEIDDPAIDTVVVSYQEPSEIDAEKPRIADDTTPRIQQHSASSQSCVVGFYRLFLDSSIRPRTLFRDLQYIAALVPAHTLDNSPEGNAFWNATIAALRIKEDILRSMLGLADAVVAHHTRNRGHLSTASTAQAERDSATFTPSRPSSALAADNVTQYSMADAAELYLIAAKDGDPVAQREVATLYLTHPEIMKRVIAPLTKSGDVFKGPVAAAAAAVDANTTSKISDGLQATEGRPFDAVMHEKYDVVAIAMARHWMELAAKGGDELAKNTLKVTDEIERIS